MRGRQHLLLLLLPQLCWTPVSQPLQQALLGGVVRQAFPGSSGGPQQHQHHPHQHHLAVVLPVPMMMTQHVLLPQLLLHTLAATLLLLVLLVWGEPAHNPELQPLVLQRHQQQ